MTICNHCPHCPTGLGNWCKYNTGGANNSQNYQCGPGLPKNIIYWIRPIFLELSNDTELEKCLHGKTQNANESFNGRIWECISKNTFAILPNLEFGAYDAVAHVNIGMKTSVLIYKRLNFFRGVYVLKSCKDHNLKRDNSANQWACPTNKL